MFHDKLYESYTKYKCYNFMSHLLVSVIKHNQLSVLAMVILQTVDWYWCNRSKALFQHQEKIVDQWHIVLTLYILLSVI